MTKHEIITLLTSNHQKFNSYFSGLSDTDFTFSKNNEKWTAGQQADHIVRSLSPLKMALDLPKWLLKLICKKANRPSLSYEKLVNKYQQRLHKGGKAPRRFVPGQVKLQTKDLLNKLTEQLVFKICKSINKYSEQELDAIVLPHPLLGRVTLREMLYFTIYHVEHHHRLTVENLKVG